MGRDRKRGGISSRIRVARWLMLAGSVTAVVALTASPASAAGTLDQSYEDMTNSGSIDIAPVVGQSFTAGITGNLDQVDVALSRTAEDASATVELRTVTNAGLPTDTVLASASVTAPAIPTQAGFVPVPLGPVAVTAGTKYAIVFTGHGFSFYGSTAGTYARGDAVKRFDDGTWAMEEGADLAFRTYVTKTCKLLRISLTSPLPPITVCL